MAKEVKQIFGLSTLFGLAVCVLTSAIYEDEQLYEGSPCTLARDRGNGTCVKLEDCPEKLEEFHAGRWRRNQEDRCGFEDRTEIVCCQILNITEKINTVNPAEAACQEYENEVSGTRKAVSFYVLAGVDAEANEFPQMAALGYPAPADEEVPGNIKYTCGGTLISRQHVLTAAHCVNNHEERVPVEVRLGSTDLASASSTEDVQRVGIASVISHPGYKRSQDYNDIAIITLQEPVRLTNSVQPACLLTKSLKNLQTSSNQTLIVVGWGATEFGGDGSRKLQKAVGLRFVELDECSIAYGKNKFPKLPNGIDDSMICAIDSNRTRQADTCGGDSGGPLFVTSVSLHSVVAGVTSFGQACGGSSPSVYTSVFNYISWIEAQVWPAKENKKRSTRAF